MKSKQALCPKCKALILAKAAQAALVDLQAALRNGDGQPAEIRRGRLEDLRLKLEAVSREWADARAVALKAEDELLHGGAFDGCEAEEAPIDRAAIVARKAAVDAERKARLDS